MQNRFKDSIWDIPDQWDFTKAALVNGFQEEFLVSSGLTIKKDEKLFDRFKGRVMFPIQVCLVE